ncbi:pentapeptide repeat-containing protein [Clostridium cylindrosporum]|uniref:Pentapeptide repeat protein n=1 Tax=Clostridium cylindrosporum DSM 605 TaxID=1121307 RepID=A0A0J8G6I6_CLOCY|nr:pentapeptide repeat-containing protein [Clostridium cylindrosporum]KMT23221.1 pentapeptide repeat protein [Clostridium cylindrosporum DSM 605]
MAKNEVNKESFNYNNIEKKDKNFMYKNLKRSNCYNCNFSNSNFDFASFRGAHFKSCYLFKCTFKGAEFVGANLKGSKFISAVFENSIFDSVNLDGTDFKDAKFKNTIFMSTDLEKAKNIDINDSGIRVFDKMPDLKISDELKSAVEDVIKNKCVKNSRIFDTKEGNINLLNIMILLENFDEKSLINGLRNIHDYIDRDFHTLSYIIRLIQKINQTVI